MKRMKLLFTTACISLFGPNLFSQNYCTQGFTTDNDPAMVTVTMNRNGLDTWILNNSGATFYSDFSETDSIMVAPGDVVDFELDINAIYVDVQYQVFVDFNFDKDFEDDGELIGVYENMNGRVIGSFAIPATSDTGRGRIRIKPYAAINLGDPGPCLDNAGEVEDYTFIVANNVPAPPETEPQYCAASGEPECGSFVGGTTGPPTFEEAHIVFVTIPGENGSDISQQSDLQDCQDATGYEDYTGIDPAVWLPGNTYTIEILRADGNIFYNSAGIYIDYNDDKDFDDPGESLIHQVDPSGNGNRHDVEIVVPPTATNGPKRVRIRTTRAANTPEPCGTQGVGQVEDYTVFIGELPPECTINHSPADGTGNICQKGLTFTWDTVPNSTTPSGYLLSLGNDNPPTSIYENQDLGDTLQFTLPDSVTLNANTTYFWRVIAYDDNGEALNCDTLSFTTSAFGDPVVSIEANGADVATFNACIGTAENLEAVVAGGTTPLNFTWNGDDVALLGNTNAANNTFTGTTEESYQFYVDVVDDNGCASSDTIDIDVLPAAVAGTVTGDDELCTDEELLLQTANFTGDVQWQLSADGTNWNDINGETAATFNSLNPSDGLFYRVKATNGDCEDFSNEIEVTVFSQSPAPSILSATGDNFFCEGNSLNLSSSSATGNNWSDGSTTQDITVNQSGTYTLFFIDGNNCPSAQASIDIEEKINPTAPVINEADQNNEANLCMGAEITLSVNETGDVLWSNGETTASITISAAGTFDITLTDDFGCVATSDPVTVVERALPSTPTISTEGGLTAFCENASLELTANVDAGNTVQWNGDMTINTLSFTAEDAGSYFVTAFNQFGCATVSDDFVVTVNPLPTQPTITSSNGTDQFCEGETFSLTSDASGNFYWNGDVTITTADIQISESGTYFVTAVSAEGCENESEKIEITLNALPSKPEISDVNGTLTSSVADGSLEFQWFTADGNPVAGETAPTYQDAPDGTYYIVVTDPQTGCQNQSEEFSHTTISISELNPASNVQIFPNPVVVGNSIKVVTDQAYQGLLLMETTGKVVATANDMEINTQGLAPGIYFLHAKNQNNLITLGKVVVK